jgi:hypothetical protein
MLIFFPENTIQSWGLKYINNIFILQRNFRYEINLEFDAKTQTILSMKKLVDNIKVRISDCSSYLEQSQLPPLRLPMW